MNPEKHIAVVGGTFDPIHFAHLELGRAALASGFPDEVWFMPSGSNNYRSVKGRRAEKYHREAMARLALEGEDPRFKLSDWECREPGSTYTSKTFAELNAIYPEVTWYYVVGADTLSSLKYWEEPELICNSTILLVAGREEQVSAADTQEAAETLRRKYDADIRFIPWNDRPVSSTKVRKSFADGTIREEDLPHGVYDYAMKHHLYLPLDNLSAEEMLERAGATPEEFEYFEKLKAELKPRRIRHSLGVMHMAMLLADGYRNVPLEKARLAGLLHDCGRLAGVPNNALGHAPAGARKARVDYGVTDEEVLSAIRWHTTGRPGMTELEKIIYVADYIEPFRGRMVYLDKARRIAYTDLDLAVIFAAQNTIQYVQSKGEEIDPITLDTEEYYRSMMRQKGGYR